MHSRVWIYQGNRDFTDAEKTGILSKGNLFLGGWQAHKVPVRSSIDIRYNRFIIILADEKHAAPGGCSIDASVHFIKSLEAEFSLILLDRTSMAYRTGGKIKIIPLSDLYKKISTGEITDDTIVFNNLVHDKAGLENEWEVPLKNSWHKTLQGNVPGLR